MRQRLTAPAVMIASGLSLYAGAALAVGLFERFPPTIVAWFRVAAAGVVLLVVVRPARWEFTRRVGLVAGVFGCVTMGMNMVFYEAIAELPLGTAVAIEFMGPIVVAAWGSRSIWDWLALLLAGGGVLLMSGARWSASPRGVIFCPVSCDVMGDLYCAGRTYCYGREFEWAPDRWFLLCHCRWIAAGCSAVAAWSRCSAAYGGWSGDSQRGDSI